MDPKDLPGGGPAFPVSTGDPARGHQNGHTTWQFPGMTLRDYFAAQFMARAQSLCETNEGWSLQNAAQCAYAIADAMLEARGA